MCFKEFMQDNTQSSLMWFILFIFAFGVTLYLSFQHFHLAFYGIETNATIVQSERGFRMSFHAYRFTTETGRVIESQSNLFPGDVERGAVGTAVPVVYRPDYPEFFVAPGIRGRFSLLLFSFIAFVCGIMLMLSLTTNKKQSKNKGDSNYVPVSSFSDV